MTDTQVKCVHIEGDKNYFVSKGAIDRFKKDIRNNDIEKLKENEYFKDGWTYELVSENELEFRVKLINKIQGPRILPCDEKTQLLKSKIKKLRKDRLNHDIIKNKSIVPKDLLNEYLALRKHKLPIELHDPSVVLEKPEEYKNIIHTMVQSFGMFKGNNNPVINYYRSLAKHLNLPTNYVSTKSNAVTKKKDAIISQMKETFLGSPPPPEDDTLGVTKDFINKLQLDRNSIPQEEIDEDMKKIYESMGINLNE